MDMRVENYALGSMSRTAKKATRAIQCAAQQNTRMHWTDLSHDDRAKRLGAYRDRMKATQKGWSLRGWAGRARAWAKAQGIKQPGPSDGAVRQYIKRGFETLKQAHIEALAGGEGITVEEMLELNLEEHLGGDSPEDGSKLASTGDKTGEAEDDLSTKSAMEILKRLERLLLGFDKKLDDIIARRDASEDQPPPTKGKQKRRPKESGGPPSKH